jgi:hypothetical protein
LNIGVNETTTQQKRESGYERNIGLFYIPVGPLIESVICLWFGGKNMYNFWRCGKPVFCVTEKSRSKKYINPLTPELNLSAQRCLEIYFTADFAS